MIVLSLFVLHLDLHGFTIYLPYLCFFFNDTATTEIYTYDTLFPYTTLFRSGSATCVASSIFPSFTDACCKRVIRKSSANSARSEEHTSELQSLMRISYAVFCLKKKKQNNSNQLNRRLHVDVLLHKRHNTNTTRNKQTSHDKK